MSGDETPHPPQTERKGNPRGLCSPNSVAIEPESSRIGGRKKKNTEASLTEWEVESAHSPSSALPPISECSPRGRGSRARETESSVARSQDRSRSRDRDRSNSRSRSSSVSRRPGAGHVRELFRIQSQLGNIGFDEQIAREDIATAETLQFSRFFSESMNMRLLSTERLQRQILIKEEEAQSSVLRRQIAAMIEGIRLDQIRERESSVSYEVMTGENRLYDRIVRKRQQLGLGGELVKSMEAAVSKNESVAELGKQSLHEDMEKMVKEAELLQAELSRSEEVLQSTAKKDRRALELELERKRDRLTKLKQMIAHNSDRDENEKRRAERATNLKGVDKDVLTGKKTVVTSKMEKDLERLRAENEKQVEIALRRALQNDKNGSPKGPQQPASARDPNNVTNLKLPSISRSVEPPSVTEKPIKARKRSSSVSAASAPAE